MDSNRPQIPALLKNTHLFRKLPEQALLDLADQFESSTYSAGTVIFKQGDSGDSFYMIMDGTVRVNRQKGSKTRELALLVKGDYFGEEALITHRPRWATVAAASDVTLLRLTLEQFNGLVHSTPHLRDNFRVAISSRHLSRRMTFNWLNKDEVIYVLARRHSIFLWVNLVLPGLSLVAAFGLFYFLYFQLLPDMVTGVVVGGLAVLAAAAWVIWNSIDWSNDYFIVTNQRVVSLEVVWALYDSRTEAPLNSLLSVGLNTSQLGRMLGYGDVMVRTFTGPISLNHVAHPEQVASMIEEYWQRAKVTAREDDSRAMEQSVRKHLAMAPAESPRVKPPERKPSFLRTMYANLFSDFIKIRIDAGDVVTYRKHWFVLFQHIWKQTAILLIIIVFMAVRLSGLITFPSIGAAVAFTILLLLIDLGWGMYDYQDWRNDVYRVTPEQIVDIEKKPFSTEQKKMAPLESILSIEYERLGFLGVLLNFGTVRISVGETKFEFAFVHNPSQVQQDIFRRMEERKVKKKQIESEAERERLSDWIATYHRSLGQGSIKPPAPEPRSPADSKLSQDQPANADPEEGDEAYY